jgi:hypothetical protein
MRRTDRTAGLFVLGLLVISLPASSFAASARRLGRPISAYSASLFGKTFLNAQQQQTLACDPDEPLFGSTSVGYDPGLVHVTGFGYAEGYEAPPTSGDGSFFSQFPSGAGIEIIRAGSTIMVDLAQYLTPILTRAPGDVETGYLQLFWRRSSSGTPGHYIPPDEDFIGSNSAFPDGVDTHFFNFEYLPGIPDEIPASYRVFDSLQRISGNRVDLMASGDPNNPDLTQPGEIIDAVIFGTAVPEPSALALVVLWGGWALRRHRK